MPLFEIGTVIGNRSPTVRRHASTQRAISPPKRITPSRLPPVTIRASRAQISPIPLAPKESIPEIREAQINDLVEPIAPTESQEASNQDSYQSLETEPDNQESYDWPEAESDEGDYEGSEDEEPEAIEGLEIGSMTSNDKPIAFVVPLDNDVIDILLRALTAINLRLLQKSRYPSLYESGVKYVREQQIPEWATKPVERFKSIPYVLKDKMGDCEDLACWLAAEYLNKGVNCWAKAIIVKDDGFRQIHIVVQFPNGKMEDPSKVLGM